METLADRLLALQHQVVRLAGDHKALKREAATAGKAAHDLQRKCDTLLARVSELERENEVLRKASPGPSGPKGTGTKERIDELVKEIDRCMALINT
ncbi:MAG: hypothetical protein RBT71_02915 [Flavobacteriales bacterium]|jgi:hypothetical protein|nr:hypothetical protein [Flavobacteriales bacterium]